MLLIFHDLPGIRIRRFRVKVARTGLFGSRQLGWVVS